MSSVPDLDPDPDPSRSGPPGIRIWYLDLLFSSIAFRIKSTKISDVNVPTASNQLKTRFFAYLKAIEEKSRIRSVFQCYGSTKPDLYKNVLNQKHRIGCFMLIESLCCRYGQECQSCHNDLSLVQEM